MLLHGWNGKLMAEKLGLPGLEVEIERAVEQVQKRVEKDDAELQSEKKEVESFRRAQAATTKTQKQQSR